LPTVRIMDAAVYVRPCDGGFLWGAFEEGPQQLDMDALGARFDVKDLSLDAEVSPTGRSGGRGAVPGAARRAGPRASRWHPDNDGGWAAHRGPGAPPPSVSSRQR